MSRPVKISPLNFWSLYSANAFDAIKTAVNDIAYDIFFIFLPDIFISFY